MAETRTDRAERALDRLDLQLGTGTDTGGLSDVDVDLDVGRHLVYAEIPDWVDTHEVRSALGVEWTTESDDLPGVVYDVPTFGVRVLVFDAGVVACLDATDRDLASAAVVATVTKLAGTPVDPSADVRPRTVSLTERPNVAADPARTGADEGNGSDDTGTTATGDTDATTVGVTPAPCSGCGRVPDGWERYCPRCGDDLKPERCAACDAPLAGWMLYCPACGADATGPV